MARLAADSGWPEGWAFDGRKNMYASTLFLPQHETQYEVRLGQGSYRRLSQC